MFEKTTLKNFESAWKIQTTFLKNRHTQAQLHWSFERFPS